MPYTAIHTRAGTEPRKAIFCACFRDTLSRFNPLLASIRTAPTVAHLFKLGTGRRPVFRRIALELIFRNLLHAAQHLPRSSCVHCHTGGRPQYEKGNGVRQTRGWWRCGRCVGRRRCGSLGWCRRRRRWHGSKFAVLALTNNGVVTGRSDLVFRLLPLLALLFENEDTIDK